MLVVLGWVALGPNFSTCSGLGWVGSVSRWVGLDRVTQNGPTDNSESSGYDDRAASVVHGYCINYSRASTTPGLLETPGI